MPRHKCDDLYEEFCIPSVLGGKLCSELAEGLLGDIPYRYLLPKSLMLRGFSEYMYH